MDKQVREETAPSLVPAASQLEVEGEVGNLSLPLGGWTEVCSSERQATSSLIPPFMFPSQ